MASEDSYREPGAPLPFAYTFPLRQPAHYLWCVVLPVVLVALALLCGRAFRLHRWSSLVMPAVSLLVALGSLYVLFARLVGTATLRAEGGTLDVRLRPSQETRGLANRTLPAADVVTFLARGAELSSYVVAGLKNGEQLIVSPELRREEAEEIARRLREALAIPDPTKAEPCLPGRSGMSDRAETALLLFLAVGVIGLSAQLWWPLGREAFVETFGHAAKAAVLAYEDTGETWNDVPVLHFRLALRPADGSPSFEADGLDPVDEEDIPKVKAVHEMNVMYLSRQRPALVILDDL